MRIVWSDEAISDLGRLYDFLAAVNPSASEKVVSALTTAPERLIKRPRLGERIERYLPREVRRLIVGRYEMRYEVSPTAILILRLWHTREDR
jgi:plasmid stabilization system protein ParE